MDVKSLYTNIPNQEGIEAVNSYLKDSDKGNLTNVISAFLTLILTLNNFKFNDEHFIQINGVWVLKAHQHTLRYSWESLKKRISRLFQIAHSGN